VPDDAQQRDTARQHHTCRVVEAEVLHLANDDLAIEVERGEEFGVVEDARRSHTA
jgi:hypothetical protein